jgi:predicted AAA+ superfamily ATPase
LDLEAEADRETLRRPDLFLPAYRDRLVVLDEVQWVPELFTALRPEIDAERRAGRFLLLGSASAGLLRQSAESLAGRIAYEELTPFLASETPPDLASLQQLWQRGGFPLSFLATDDEASLRWRQAFLRTLLQRDLPALGIRVAEETMRRFMTMLAHLQGQLLNAAQLGQALGGVSHTTVARYVDHLVDALLARRLEPHQANVGKRLVKSPKVYLRDSGLVHALLGLSTPRDLQGHPVVGASWEGFVIEQIAAAMPAGAHLGFYRTSAGAEVDAVVHSGSRRVAFEVKFSSAPKPTRGFWQALEELQIDEAYVVAPVARRYPLSEGVQVLPVWEVAGVWRAAGR